MDYLRRVRAWRAGTGVGGAPAAEPRIALRWAGLPRRVEDGDRAGVRFVGGRMSLVALPFLFSPRSYQAEVDDDWERGIRRFITVWPRRGGKDHHWLNFIIKRMRERPGTYIHLFPELAMGRRIIWTELTIDGINFLEHFPRELCVDDNRRGRNISDMTVTFKNGSVYRVMGADMPDRLRGINPVGVVFSEWAWQSGTPWRIIEPILLRNKGWAGFNSTPDGSDEALAPLWKGTEGDPKWHRSLHTVEDICCDGVHFRYRNAEDEKPAAFASELVMRLGKDVVRYLWRKQNPELPFPTEVDPEALAQAGVMALDDYWERGFEAELEGGEPLYTQAEIDDMRRRGVDEDFIQQELYCSFGGSRSGSYYGKLIAEARNNGRVTVLPWEPRVVVSTVWDIGRSDATAIWFFQTVGREIRLIDYHELAGQDITAHVKAVKERPYVYGQHWAPHDIKIQDWGSQKSRLEIARDLGINFRIVPQLSKMDGINAARSILPRCYFDEIRCDRGLAALEGYRKRFIEKLQIYSDEAVHDRWSHGADAFRYLALVADLEQDLYTRGIVTQSETEFDVFEA
jgi:hypothetical protein